MIKTLTSQEQEVKAIEDACAKIRKRNAAKMPPRPQNLGELYDLHARDGAPKGSSFLDLCKKAGMIR